MTGRVELQPEVLVFPDLGVDSVGLGGQDRLDLAWDSLSDQQRVAMTVMVSESLRRLAETVETWLPADVKLDQLSNYVIQVTWKNRHLDRTIVELVAKAATDRVRRVDELRHLAGGSGGADRASS